MTTTPDEASGTRGGSDATNGPPPLAVEGLAKTFGSGDDAVHAVDGLDLTVERGSVVGLLGPNGAGKTTTIKSILGLVVPDEGTVEIAGIDADANPRWAYRHVDAMLEGARNTYWRLTARENLEFFARLAGRNPAAHREEFDALLERFDLADEADTAVRELSRGQKQKVSLVSALSGEADLLFLDEPTLGLDVESSLELRRELARLVAEEALTVVLSSHDMDVIEDLCDRVVIMNDGEVIADDSVRNLIDLFRTQAYAITVEGSVPTELERTLHREYDVSGWEETGDRTRFEASLRHGNEIHGLTGRLVEADLEIVAVSTVEPDFEDVFLSLTEDGAHGAEPAPDSAGGTDRFRSDDARNDATVTSPPGATDGRGRTNGGGGGGRDG